MEYYNSNSRVNMNRQDIWLPSYCCPQCIAHAIQTRDGKLLEHLLTPPALLIRDSFLVLTSRCVAIDTDLESLLPQVPEPVTFDGSERSSSSGEDCGHQSIDPELLDARALDWTPGAPFLVNIFQLAVHLSNSHFDALTPLCRRFPQLTREVLAFHEIRPVDQLIELQGGPIPGVLMACLNNKSGVQSTVRVTTKCTNLVGLLAARRPIESLLVSRLLAKDLIDLREPIQSITMKQDEDATDEPSNDDSRHSSKSENMHLRDGVVTGREVDILLDMSQQLLVNPTSINYLHTMAECLQTLIRLGCDVNAPLDEMLFYIAPQNKYECYTIFQFSY